MWFEMLKFANAMSAAHEPPLSPCYVVGGCAKTKYGARFYCKEFEMNAESVYECEGYRLPTRAEWQYAARAGTTTAYYSGPMTVDEALENKGCFEDTNLNPIAWYSVNSGRRTHPVGLKLPNAWGLYDLLGNAAELLHDRERARSPAPFATDPFGELGLDSDHRPIVGGLVIAWPSLLRVASSLGAAPALPSTAHGFRLARTLGKGTLPTLDDVSEAP